MSLKLAAFRSDPHCRKLLITTYSDDLMAILFSRLIAFVECCVAVPANRIGSKTMTLEQGIRYLSREEKVRHITGRPCKVVKRLIFHEKEAQT